MAACHLIADGELTLLGDIAADNLVYAGCELIAVLAGELFNLDNNAVFAVETLREVSLTSLAFSPNIARRSLSSAVS